MNRLCLKWLPIPLLFSGACLTKPSVPEPSNQAQHFQKIEKQMEDAEARITAEITSLRNELLKQDKLVGSGNKAAEQPAQPPEAVGSSAEAPEEGGALAIPTESQSTALSEVAEESKDARIMAPAPEPEPAKTEAEAEPTVAEIEKTYSQAYAAYVAGKSDEAARLWRDLAEQHPQAGLAANVRYWLAEIEYDAKNYNAALLAFQEVVKNYPESEKAAAALLKMGKSHEMLGQIEEALKSYQELIQKYPKSDAAKLAKSWM